MKLYYSAALTFGVGVAAGALADVEAGAAPFESPAKFFLFPDLKSVSYQPPPFKRKPAAEICFFNVGLPHSGQSINALSLKRCKASN